MDHFESKVLNCDVLLLTETQLTAPDSDNDIKDQLYPFILNRQDSDEKKTKQIKAYYYILCADISVIKP